MSQTVTSTLDLPDHVLRSQYVVAFSRDGARHEVVISSTSTIGSDPSLEVVLNDRTVSRLHAELEVRSDGVWVRDLGSKNGTFIGSVKVVQACIPEAATVRVGNTELTVTRQAAPAKIELWPQSFFGPLVGKSAVMREMFVRLSKYAKSTAPVLVEGETGTGKELVARALHDARSATAPYVVVDCSALPETLLESELFGHARGAFTGATHARAGAFEEADGGTVFIDEIGELPLAMQPKLLRVLESRTVRRLGETEHRPIDVRFVFATHRNLREMVTRGEFREDLYFRVSVLPLKLPPLRARREDVPLLIEHFLAGRKLGPEDLHQVLSLPLRGNVRELRNFVERALAVGTP
ncbi:hypothetical protein BH09MYX1_BH09MYX1_61020 [soil metagenome]